MYLFLLVAFPAFFIGWLFAQPDYKRTSYLFPIISGAIIAALVCTIKALFVFSKHTWTTFFLSGFIHLLFVEVLLPCALLYGAFLFFSKDDNDYRASSFLPLMAAFYAVFIPYRVITMSEPLSVFPLFVKPIIYVSMVSYLSSIAFELFAAIDDKNKNKIIHYSGVAFLSACFPPALEAWWHLGGKLYFIIPLAVIYTALAFALYLKMKKDTIQKPIFMTM